MAVSNPYQSYQQNSIQTASPERLVIMMYDGVIRFLNQAKQALEKKELEKVHVNLTKAQAIFAELMVNLDMQYEISQQLFPLYEFCKNHLVEANLKKDASLIDEVLNLTIDLRSTWEQAIRIAKSGQVTQV